MMLSQCYVKNSEIFSLFFPPAFPTYSWHTPLNICCFFSLTINSKKPSDFFVLLNILPSTNNFQSSFSMKRSTF